MLVDSFNRNHTYLRISVTDKCNLRCYYCMPNSTEAINFKKQNELLTFVEIERIAKIFIDSGVTKIRLTGGEPLVRTHLPDLVKALSKYNKLEHIALTTNGILFSDYAQELKDAGLNSVNISIDSLKKERFLAITKQDKLEQVLRSIDIAEKLGFVPVKLNVVIMKGVNDDEILDLVDYIANRKLNIRFIEYMPFKDNGWQQDSVFSYRQIYEIISSKYELLPIVQTIGAVAKDFKINGCSGTVSFISSMTDSFCASCNRLRITADGQLKSCLFYEPEVSLKDILRSGGTDEILKEQMYKALALKPEAHPDISELATFANRSMIEIGG